MYLVSANSMSESQRRSHRGEIAFFKAPVVFGLGKSIGITGERLHNSFFKDVLSPVIDKTIMLNDSIQETAQSPLLMINAKGGIHKKRLEWRIFKILTSLPPLRGGEVSSQ